MKKGILLFQEKQTGKRLKSRDLRDRCLRMRQDSDTRSSSFAAIIIITVSSDQRHHPRDQSIPHTAALTIMQLDDERVIDFRQDVSLHLRPDPVPHCTTKTKAFRMHAESSGPRYPTADEPVQSQPHTRGNVEQKHGHPHLRLGLRNTYTLTHLLPCC